MVCSSSSEQREVTIPALTVHDKSMRIIEAKVNTTLEAWLFRSVRLRSKSELHVFQATEDW